jgi:DNA invertase Pin-like site-specific DNA recombinase
MDCVRDLVAAGEVSVVLAQDRDCFSREPAYTYLLRRDFEEYGCELRALNDHGDGSPEGELTHGILDQLAKYERAKVPGILPVMGRGLPPTGGVHGSLRWLS